MEHRIKDWVEALIEIQNVMDAWLKVGVIPPSAGYSVDCFVLVMCEGVYAGHTDTLLTPPPPPTPFASAFFVLSGASHMAVSGAHLLI